MPARTFELDLLELLLEVGEQPVADWMSWRVLWDLEFVDLRRSDGSPITAEQPPGPAFVALTDLGRAVVAARRASSTSRSFTG